MNLGFINHARFGTKMMDPNPFKKIMVPTMSPSSMWNFSGDKMKITHPSTTAIMVKKTALPVVVRALSLAFT